MSAFEYSQMGNEGFNAYVLICILEGLGELERRTSRLENRIHFNQEDRLNVAYTVTMRLIDGSLIVG